MVFSSLLFTFAFLPIFLGLYYIIKDQYKNILLLLASLAFYTYGEKKYVIVMVASIIVNYFLAIEMDKFEEERKKRRILITGILVNLSFLFLFKYLSFVLKISYNIFGNSIHFSQRLLNIHLPIGISFYTFQVLSYLIDVYRKEVRPEKNILNLGLYISFFPQLVAGPIVRYNTIASQIKSRSITVNTFSDGCRRYMIGFCKKILLANQLFIVSNAAFNSQELDELTICMAWLGAISFSLQIFFDFSGYSDMAIGLGKMFGFEFEENFNYPYMSQSITEFWRRWHISLGKWFKDYVYIPLGGGRVKPRRHILNLFIVWLLTGIWHGANVTFVVWGVSYFVFIVIEKKVLGLDKRTFKGIARIIWRVIVLFVIVSLWVVFNSDDLGQAFSYIKTMFGLGVASPVGIREYYLIKNYGVFIVAAIVFSFPIAPFVRNKIKIRGENVWRICNYVMACLYGFIFMLATSYLVMGSHNPFIYFNF